MRIIIVEGGISGIFCAILTKQNHPDYHISVIEHKERILKKLLLTGNGKCNFANKDLSLAFYNHPEFVKHFLNEENANDIVSFFNRLGVKTKLVGNLYYPISATALTVMNALNREINRLGIEIMCNTDVVDYDNNNKLVITKDSALPYDKLIFACGGKAYPNMGSDGSIYEILKKHHYDIIDIKPSLCPIKVRENVHAIEGLRRWSRVSLIVDKQVVHSEEGEVLFKKDGLSGIVIFNISHIINLYHSKDIKLELDICLEDSGPINNFDEYFHPAIAHYLNKHQLDPHHILFTYKSHYPFANAQVSDGGISISQLDKDLSSIIEKDVYFAGEMLDVSGICGGYNIMWAYYSSKTIADKI